MYGNNAGLYLGLTFLPQMRPSAGQPVTRVFNIEYTLTVMKPDLVTTTGLSCSGVTSVCYVQSFDPNNPPACKPFSNSTVVYDATTCS